MLWSKELWLQELALFLGKYKLTYAVWWKVEKEYYLKMSVHVIIDHQMGYTNKRLPTTNHIALGNLNKTSKIQSSADFDPGF